VSITGILTAVVIGLVVGLLPRALRAATPVGLAIPVAVVFAFAGTFVARAAGIPTATNGIDWLELLIQVVVAVVGVLLAGAGFVAVNGPRRPVELPAAGWSAPGVDAPDRRPTPPGPARHRPAGQSRPQARTRIFVSYRRADSRHAARGLASALRQRFGQDQVFVDVDSVRPGLDFVTEVQTAVRASAVVIVVIGEGWFGARPGAGSRLHEQDDTVRLEIEEALHSRLPILPVLLDGAAMPRPEQLPGSIASLHRINALPVGHETWDRDVETLLEAVARLRG
jgi:hypothetical protein